MSIKLYRLIRLKLLLIFGAALVTVLGLILFLNDVHSNVSLANYFIILLITIVVSIVFYITISTIRKYSVEVETAKQDVINASIAKEQFFASMSHEIRTPLNAINGLTQILLSEDPREDQIENLNLLRFSGDNLLTLINDILDISKIGSGKLTLEKRPFDFQYLIQNIPRSMDCRARENLVRINVNYDARLPSTFTGDVTRLSQIIYNLTGNAIKFAGKGEVNISVRYKGQEGKAYSFRVSVKDNGIGIAPENQEKIFNSFEQAEPGTTRQYGGTGLGLCITKSLLQLMGTDIQLESELGKGSTFYFDLTLDSDPIEGHTPGSCLLSGTPDFSGRNVGVLIAEDNKANQIIISKFLSRAGVNFDIVDNGKEALKLVESQKYDMLFMDLQMPVMDGLTATKKIRSKKANYYQQLPIIALTADIFAEGKGKAVANGMTDYLSKPFKPADLYRIIEEYTQKSNLETGCLRSRVS